MTSPVLCLSQFWLYDFRRCWIQNESYSITATSQSPASSFVVRVLPSASISFRFGYRLFVVVPDL